MCYLLWYKSLAKTISTKSLLDYHLLKTFNNFCYRVFIHKYAKFNLKHLRLTNKSYP